MTTFLERSTGRTIGIALLAILLLSPAAAVAQETRRAPVRPVPDGATIFVLDTHGVEHRGRLIRFDDQELVMYGHPRRRGNVRERR